MVDAEWSPYGEAVCHYAVRHLERFPLGTPYTDVAARLAGLFANERLAGLFANERLAGSKLVVDQTVVGTPVRDLLRNEGIDADIVPSQKFGWSAFVRRHYFGNRFI